MASPLDWILSDKGLTSAARSPKSTPVLSSRDVSICVSVHNVLKTDTRLRSPAKANRMRHERSRTSSIARLLCSICLSCSLACSNTLLSAWEALRPCSPAKSSLTAAMSEAIWRAVERNSSSFSPTLRKSHSVERLRDSRSLMTWPAAVLHPVRVALLSRERFRGIPLQLSKIENRDRPFIAGAPRVSPVGTARQRRTRLQWCKVRGSGSPDDYDLNSSQRAWA